MADLREDLRGMLRGRVAVVGVGNPDLGDDGAGPRLAEELATRGVPDVLVGERTPERWLGRLRGESFDSILLLDAVDAGRAPGDALLMDAGAVEARFPQVSTHRLSLGTLARLLQAGGAARVVLLGIQPRSLAPGTELTPTVQRTLSVLADVLTDVLAPSADPAPRASDLRSPTSNFGPRTADRVCGEQP